jgi:hypothetical protein
MRSLVSCWPGPVAFARLLTSLRWLRHAAVTRRFPAPCPPVMSATERLTQDASMTPGATRTADAAHAMRVLLDRIVVLLTIAAVLGVVLVGRIGRAGVLNPGKGVNTFFEQYRRHEPVFLALMVIFALVTAFTARRSSLVDGDGPTPPRWWSLERLGLDALVAVSVIVFALTAVGTWSVMHAFPLSMDEYAAGFQARALAAGHIAVSLPDAWNAFGRALTPVFVVYEPDRHVWLSAYWPVYGALRAVFLRVGADHLLNPALAAAALPLLYACARRLWPDNRARAWLAVGFLALSSQFLFMSMTGYAMPAHLAITLLWIYAYTRNDRAGWLAAPVIGVVALGLHNPFPHALFVTPFLFHLLVQRRWRWTAYFAAVYLAGVAVCFEWGRTVTAASEDGRMLSLFQTPGLLMLSVQHLSLTVMLSWQTPLLAMLLVLVAFSWRSLSGIERCLAIGIVLPFLLFMLYPSTQGRGWGYRYVYGVLGNMALLGTSGMARLRVARRLVTTSALATVLVQLPIRAWQIEHYVRPFVQVHEYVEHIDADVVIVDPTTSWYGIDLVRNDPFLTNTPKVLSAFFLRRADKQALAARYGDRVHMLTAEEIGQFGIPTFRSRFRKPPWPE